MLVEQNQPVTGTADRISASFFNGSVLAIYYAVAALSRGS